jgi:hypothetical protein
MTAITPSQNAAAAVVAAIEHPVIKAAAVRRSLGWYVRRSLLGVALMVAAVGAGAWLFHASIEAEAGDGSKFGTIED